MNTEAYNYVLISALLGMGVVFIFLWVLSLIMSWIKLLFGEKPQKGLGTPVAETAAVASSTNIAAGTSNGKDESVPVWVFAAVAAYLIEEELESQRSAESWAPVAAVGSDPWVVLPRF